jgi:hypothetical protein
VESTGYPLPSAPVLLGEAVDEESTRLLVNSIRAALIAAGIAQEREE